MISFDLLVLQQVQSRLPALSMFSHSISAGLSASRGKASDQERETIDILNELCSHTLPALFQSSSNLLGAIAQQAQEADALAGKGFEG